MHVIVSFCRQASNAVNELDAAGIKARRQLWCAAVFCALFMVNEHTFIRATAYLCFLSQIGELLGGYYANSLSLMTDAAHLLSDLAGFLISIFALVCKTEFLFHLLLNPLFLSSGWHRKRLQLNTPLAFIVRRSWVLCCQCC